MNPSYEALGAQIIDADPRTSIPLCAWKVNSKKFARLRSLLTYAGTSQGQRGGDRVLQRAAYIDSLTWVY
jgi:hypothetical protein